MYRTIEIFREISNIYRESGKENEIANYLINFAKKNNLEFIKDNYNNVLIKKYVNSKNTIILQAHTDMVCVKTDESFDFSKDKINVISDKGYIRAINSSLGADNGIGVAQILNVLESNVNVNIEALFTSEEETTMNGALNFDTNLLKGKYLLNLDGFNENTIIKESACFYDLSLQKENYLYDSTINKNKYIISLSGLLGGHSGFDINKNKGNSLMILAKFLMNIKDIKLIKFNGGEKINVIPSNATCEFSSMLDINEINNYVNDYLMLLKKKYKDIKIDIIKKENNNISLTNDESLLFLKFISNFPSKIFNKINNKQVTTSVNLSIVSLNKILFSMRSSRKEEENECLTFLKKYVKSYNWNFFIDGYQPGFYSDDNIYLIKNLINSCPFKDKPKLKSVHIAVEVGIFKEKMNDLEIAIISPNIKDAHTINEKVNINSIKKTDKWIKNFLDNFN
ncbi:MAG: M20/M25/M40 family metallo-hydrolase [Clostridia bacterium]